MRIVDCRWFITVKGIPGVTTWDAFCNYLKSKNVNLHSYISFAGASYPSTVLGFKHLKFVSNVKIGTDTAIVSITTTDNETLEDVSNPNIAFEVCLSSIVAIGDEFEIKHIIPLARVDVSLTSVLSCL